jgi:hypothetical protein
MTLAACLSTSFCTGSSKTKSVLITSGICCYTSVLGWATFSISIWCLPSLSICASSIPCKIPAVVNPFPKVYLRRNSLIKVPNSLFFSASGVLFTFHRCFMVEVKLVYMTLMESDILENQDKSMGAFTILNFYFSKLISSSRSSIK